MKKIPSNSSTNSLLTEQMFNLLIAPNAFDDSLRKFNEISSSRHLKLNILIRDQINDSRNKDSCENPSPPFNNIF
ncbi:MAG: hypothetical protein IPI30_12635 [Saprospiraceae bacterium]|nr:hypothetical protein [Candidatus Vicinibacter affinis]